MNMSGDEKVASVFALCATIIMLWAGYLTFQGAKQHGQDSLERVTICTQTNLTGLDLELCLDGQVQR